MWKNKASVRFVLALVAVAPVLFAQSGCGGLASSDPRTVHSATPVLVENTFGFNIHNALQDWPTVPFGFWRLWDANVDWARVEPESGVFDFSLLDQYVALAQQHNVQIIYVLGNTPSWAATDPTATGNERVPGGISPPKNIQDWQNFVQAVATRYRSRIRGYEIWNEANLSGYWIGTAGQYMDLAQTAFSTIKRIDPAATVLAPSVVAHSGLDFLNSFLSNGGASSTDAIPYHLYDTAKLPEQAITFYEDVLGIAQQWHKDVWDTEVGWGPWGTFTDAESAAFLARTFVLQSAAGVTHIIWYAWDDRGPWVHLFLVQPDLRTPTLAATAFGEVQSWLQNSSVSCFNADDGSWQCTVAPKGGAQKFIVWNPSNDQTFSVPAEWKVTRMRDLRGNEQSIVGSQVNLTASPILLEP